MLLELTFRRLLLLPVSFLQYRLLSLIGKASKSLGTTPIGQIASEPHAIVTSTLNAADQVVNQDQAVTELRKGKERGKSQVLFSRRLL